MNEFQAFNKGTLQALFPYRLPFVVTGACEGSWRWAHSEDKSEV